MRSLAEWMLALGVVWGVLWLALPIARSLIPPPPGTVTLVESPLPAPPVGVPAGAESVPLLMFDTSLVVQLGMPERDIRDHAFARYAAGSPLTEPGVLGERIVLPFRVGPSRFWVVLDRTDVDREREVTGIYVR